MLINTIIQTLNVRNISGISIFLLVYFLFWNLVNDLCGKISGM